MGVLGTQITNLYFLINLPDLGRSGLETTDYSIISQALCSTKDPLLEKARKLFVRVQVETEEYRDAKTQGTKQVKGGLHVSWDFGLGSRGMKTKMGDVK